MPRKAAPEPKHRPVFTEGRAAVVNIYLRLEYLEHLDALATELGGSRSDAIYHLLDNAPRRGAKSS